MFKMDQREEVERDILKRYKDGKTITEIAAAMKLDVPYITEVIAAGEPKRKLLTE